MEILIGMLYAIIAIFLVLCIRPITTFIHEMGHALPALWFTDQEVTIYVGSYGDTDNSSRFQLGRLTIYLQFNLFYWDMGLCTFHGRLNNTQSFITILGGPLLSLLLAAYLFNLMISNAYSDGVATMLALFIISSVWDFFINIIPRNGLMNTHSTEAIMNDGAQLVRLIRLGKGAQEYQQELHKLKTTPEEANIDRLMELMHQSKYPLQMLDEIVPPLIEQKQHDQALELLQEYHNKKHLKTYHYLLLGDIYRAQGKAHDALQAYERYWYYHFNDPATLNKKAAVLMDTGQYHVAADDIRISLEMQPFQNTDALFNRVRYHLHERDFEAVKNDLVQIESESPQNPQLFYFQGRYHEEKWDYQEAIECYEKAAAAGASQHDIPMRIEELKQLLER